jgi:glutathione S-transferase
MTLKLYHHPFASFCQKALIALYEADVGFEPVLVDLGDPPQREVLARLWPLAKFPVLRDEEAGVTLPESSIVTEYAAPAMIPADPAAALQARLWDRVFDNYVALPMQRIVADTFRPAGLGDAVGVEQARALIGTAYGIADAQLAGGSWAAGNSFTLADCAAAPALFYSNIVVPFGEHRHLVAYYQRLLERPSFARVVEEARPYRHLFPLPWPEGY